MYNVCDQNVPARMLAANVSRRHLISGDMSNSCTRCIVDMQRWDRINVKLLRRARHAMCNQICTAHSKSSSSIFKPWGHRPARQLWDIASFRDHDRLALIELGYVLGLPMPITTPTGLLVVPIAVEY